MSDTKHTPGPWQVGKQASIYADAGHPHIDCIAHYFQWAPEQADEAKANARLIAAAPDLLEACKDLIRTIEQLTDVDNLTERILAEPERYEGFRASIEIAGQAIDKAEAQEVKP